MGQNKFNKYFLILISFFTIYSCQFEWVEERRIYLNKIEFGLSVRDTFKQKSIKYFSEDSSNNDFIPKGVYCTLGYVKPRPKGAKRTS